MKWMTEKLPVHANLNLYQKLRDMWTTWSVVHLSYTPETWIATDPCHQKQDEVLHDIPETWTGNKKNTSTQHGEQMSNLAALAL